MMASDVIEFLREGNEIARHERVLMKKLIERVLAVRAGFSQ
jgi:hypothetical protein